MSVWSAAQPSWVSGRAQRGRRGAYSSSSVSLPPRRGRAPQPAASHTRTRTHTEVCSCIHLKCAGILPGGTKPCKPRGGNKKTCLLPPKIITCNPKTQYKIPAHLRWMQEPTSKYEERFAQHEETHNGLRTELSNRPDCRNQTVSAAGRAQQRERGLLAGLVGAGLCRAVRLLALLLLLRAARFRLALLPTRRPAQHTRVHATTRDRRWE